jgi:glycosyltransferase involved in cell wall biosynthesis
MRVALITENASVVPRPEDTYPAGPGAGLGALAMALAGQGAQVTVYAPGPGRTDGSARPRRRRLAPGAVLEQLSIGPAGGTASRRRSQARDRAAQDLTALRIRDLADQLGTRWRDDPPDLVHAHSWATGVAAQAGGRGLNLPPVQTFYSLAAADGPDAHPSRRARLELALARSARAVLVGASADGAALRRRGVPQTAIRVVPTGVDTSHFQPDGPAASRDGRSRLLMMLTGLAGDSGPAAALHALAAVPGAELLIAGGPDEAELPRDPGYRALRKLASQLGVTDRVTITGQVSRADTPALMRSADLLLNLSPDGMAAQVTIDAMACGVPVIAVSTSAHQDAVLDGTTGYLVSGTAPGPLARRIRQLLATPLREGMAIAAASRARDRYSWERIGTETVAVYETAVRDTAGEPACAEAGPVDEA